MGDLSLANLKVRIQASCEVVNDFAGGAATTKTNLLLSLISELTTGTGVNQADIAWLKDGGTSGGTTTVALDVYDGALFDGTESAGETGGKAQTMAEGILLVVFNRAASDVALTLGGLVSSAAWSPPLSDNDGTEVSPGGALVFFSPDATAYPITDGSKHLVEVTPQGGNITYDVLVLGRSA